MLLNRNSLRSEVLGCGQSLPPLAPTVPFTTFSAAFRRDTGASLLPILCFLNPIHQKSQGLRVLGLIFM